MKGIHFEGDAVVVISIVYILVGVFFSESISSEFFILTHMDHLVLEQADTASSFPNHYKVMAIGGSTGRKIESTRHPSLVHDPDSVKE